MEVAVKPVAELDPGDWVAGSVPSFETIFGTGDFRLVGVANHDGNVTW